MTDLIKRDDALAVVNGWHQITHIRAALEAVPIVTTHRYAGESEASVYDRKGFPPIEIAIDPAAIPALQARIEELVKENYQLTISLEMCHVGWDQALDEREAAEAKLTKAVEFIRRHIPDSVYEQRQRANAFLAELDGK